MEVDAENVKRPSRRLFFMELRAIPELASFIASAPFLNVSAPRGDGHPVLVLPGLATSDRSTIALRRFLKSIGYPVYGWEMGRNWGPLPGIEEGLLSRIDEISENHGRKVSLVGWSLGGIYARQLAKMRPDSTRCVVTLGSPFSGNPRATNAWKLYEFASGHRVEDRESHMGGAISDPPPVPTTAIFSKTDGICAWQLCVEKETAIAENIQVHGSHCGLGHHPAAVYAIADRLSQQEGQWRKFERKGVKGFVYPQAATA